MKEPFYNNDERNSALLLEAGKWQGTPWRPRSCAKGVGVSCHMYPRALYIGSHFLDESFPIIEETPNLLKHSKESAMAKWLDERPEFATIERDGYIMRAGDLLGFQIGSCVTHLGVAVSEKVLTHVLMKLNTCYSHLSDPTWNSRLKRIWRPIA